jgi:two-component system response regulator (stage 0 sporulation protein F)
MTQHFVDGTVINEGVHEPDRGRTLLATDSSSSSSYALVIDDESVIREFLTRCLEGWGYAVKQAGSAAEALEMMVTKPASVVLCDIKMPGHDGLWLAERLRSHWPQTRVIMVTALDDGETVEQSREVGAFDYITKPIRREQLQEVLRRATTIPAEVSLIPEGSTSASSQPPAPDRKKFEAEYTLECPVRCSSCGERISTVKAVRLVRAQVNFTSTLPRRGRVAICPCCQAVIPVELSNF